MPGPRPPGSPPREGSARQAGRPFQASGSDERRTGYRWVGCDRCGAAVQVAKFSPQHTSVQWSAAAVLACAEFSALAERGRPSALVEGCASLRDSIERAVLQGRLEVSPP